MKLAAIGDLHCTDRSQGEIRRMLEGVDREARVLLLAGDLTNCGLLVDGEVLIEELGQLRLPKIAVLGNHDHENDRADELGMALSAAGVHMLNSSTCVIDGIGFVGAKGFGGGFGQRRIQPFGERSIKTFVQASIEETTRLETAMKALATERKVALLHYSPVRETLLGESPEIFPFLGCSLLADALDRQGAAVILHGHAHNGTPGGRTAGGIPVHNVSRYVQSRNGGRPYLLFEV